MTYGQIHKYCREDNGIWYGYVPAARSPDGRYKRFSLGTRNERLAEKRLWEEVDGILRGEWGQAENPPVGEFLEAYLSYRRQSSYDEKTVEKDARALAQLFESAGVARLAQVTSLHVEEFLMGRASAGRQASTVDIDRRHIHRAFEWALLHRMVLKNPAAGIEPLRSDHKPRHPVFSKEDLERIFRYVPGDRRHRTLWLFLLYSGMRISEALSLLQAHVTDEFIEVHQAKGGRGRTVPLTPALREILAQQTGDHPFVFGGAEPFTDRKTAGRHLRRHITRLNDVERERAEREGRPPELTVGTLHTFKATYITRALLDGVPSAKVALWVGTSLKVIERDYLRPLVRDIARDAHRVSFGFTQHERALAGRVRRLQIPPAQEALEDTEQAGLGA